MQRNKSVCKILKRLVISFDCCRKREFQYWDPCKLSFVLLNEHHLWPCSNGSSDSWFHDRKFRNHKAVLCCLFCWINPGWSRQRRVSKMVKTCLQSTISCSEFLYLSALTSLTALGVAQNLCDKGLKGQFRIFSALDLRIMSQCSHPVVHHASLAYTEPRASKTVARVKIGWQHLTTTMYTFIDSCGYQNVCYIMLHVFTVSTIFTVSTSNWTLWPTLNLEICFSWLQGFLMLSNISSFLYLSSVDLSILAASKRLSSRSRSNFSCVRGHF